MECWSYSAFSAGEGIYREPPGRRWQSADRGELVVVKEHMNEVFAGAQARVAGRRDGAGGGGVRGGGQGLGVLQLGGVRAQERFAGSEFLGRGTAAQGQLESGGDEGGVGAGLRDGTVDRAGHEA